MQKLYKLLFTLFILTNLVFIQSCKKDENPVIPPEETTKIPATTKYITSNDYINYFEGFSTDSTQLLFKKDLNTKYSLATNNVIAFSEGSGLLRKVTGIQTTNTQLIVSTAQGTLEDAIENGTIEYSGALSKRNLLKIEILTDGIQYDKTLNKTNETEFDFDINKVLYDEDNNLSTTNDQIRLNGTFTFTSDIFVKILVKNFKLQYAKYGFEADNSESLNLEAMIQYNLSKEIEVARVTFTPITIQVGILPVIIVPDLRIKIGVNGYANAGISTSIQNEFHFEAGSEFMTGNGWQPYKTFTNNFNYNPPSLTANCGARAYIKPEINMAVYGVLAGYAYGEAYGKLEADLLQSPWWKLYVGYNLGIGARAEILGHGLFDFVLDGLIQKEMLIAQSSTQNNTVPFANFNINPTSGTTNTLFQFDASSSTDLQDPPSALQVRWDWEGDGTWDTQYSTTKVGTHQFNVAGNYVPILEVKDSGGLTDTETKSLVVSSEVEIPIPPILSSPLNGVINISVIPTLSWNPSSGADSYTLQVSENSNFTNFIYNQNGLTGTSQQVTGLSNSTKYYWRVSATNSIGTSDWSSIWNFTTSTVGTTNGLRSVNFISPTTGWASGVSGTILKTTDAGNTWFTQNSGTPQELSSIFCISTTKAWAVGKGGTIRKTTDGGNTWDSPSSGTTQWLASVFFVSETIGWIIGHGGTILKTENGGANWTQQNSGVTNKLNSGYFTSTNAGWAVGDNGKILKTTNAGSSWFSQSSGTTLYLFSVNFISASLGWAAGDAGKILKTTNGGSNWNVQNSGTGARLYSVYFADANNGWVVGTNGMILRTTNGGSSWITQTSGTTKSLQSVYFISLTTGWIVGEGGIILHTTDGGNNWIEQ